MPEKQLNLFQKLSKIREMSEVIGKDKSGYGYRYTSLNEILAKVTAGMKKYGVSLIPNIKQEIMTVEPHSYKKTKVAKQLDI